MSVRRRFWEVAEEGAQPLLNGRGVLAQARDRLLPVGQMRHQRAAALDIEQLVQRHARPAALPLRTPPGHDMHVQQRTAMTRSIGFSGFYRADP